MRANLRLLRIDNLYGHNDIMMIGLHESVLAREDEPRRTAARRIVDAHEAAGAAIIRTARGELRSSIDPQPCRRS
jgi:hypothetical protein